MVHHCVHLVIYDPPTISMLDLLYVVITSPYC